MVIKIKRVNTDIFSASLLGMRGSAKDARMYFFNGTTFPVPVLLMKLNLHPTHQEKNKTIYKSQVGSIALTQVPLLSTPIIKFIC
jgi:hypothetical protein